MKESSIQETNPPNDQDLYLPDQAANYPKATLRFFLVGLMGSGKTYWSKKLAKQYNLTAYDLDSVITENEHCSVSEIFSSKGEGFFRDLEKEALLSFGNKQNFILSCGGGTPCFHNNMEWMNKNGITIWIDESLDIIAERLIHSKNVRPLIKDKSDEQLASYLKTLLAERTPFYNKAAFRLQGPISIDLFKQIFKNHA